MSVLRTARNVGETLVPKVARTIAAPILLLILLIYYFINGPLIFGTLWDQPGFSNAILAYLMFTIAAFALAAVPLVGGPLAKDLFKPVQSSLLVQLLVFLGVAVLVNTLIALSGFRLINATITNFVQVALFLLGVAGAEELFFRGALFRTGPLISSAAFAAFHAYVYSSSASFIFAIVFALGAGVAFYYLYAATRERFGLAVNTAAHWGYDCALLGVVFLGPVFVFLFG